jgi:hypothetical protein
VANKKQASDEKFEQQEFDLFQALAALDNKNYSYYQNLTEEQRKKFVPYMMTHWMSSITGKSAVSSYYLMSTEVHANMHLFNERVQAHPELQWLMLCAASPGLGKQYHSWIPHLSPKIGKLQETVKKKEVQDYYTKIMKGTSADETSALAQEFTQQINHRVTLAKIYEHLKLDDITVLAKFVTTEEITEYEKESGIG